MAKLFTYGDRETQALHLSRYLKRAVNLFAPSDLEVQPIYVDLPNFPDACFMLVIGADADVALLVGADAVFNVSVLADANVTIDDNGIPDFVLKILPNASYILDVSDCED